jgi:hypothetical protein
MRLRILALSCVFVTVGLADTLILRDGTEVRGKFVGGDSHHVRIAVGNRTVAYDVAAVKTLRFGADTASEPAAPRAALEQSAPGVSEVVSPASEASSSIMIPAGTSVIVRTIDPVDSQVNRPGDTFKASIDEPVVVDGQTVIQRGADAVVKLVQQSGKMPASTELALDLFTVRVRGRNIDVNSQDVTTAGTSQTKRSATVIGGAAALSSGAGANRQVKIPAETRLEFILQQAVQF